MTITYFILCLWYYLGRSVEETHDVIFVGKWTMFQMGGHEGENQLFSKLPSPYFDDGEDQGNEHF